MILSALSRLKINTTEFNPETLPHTENYLEVGYIKLPLYGELTVEETAIFNKASESLNSIQQTLISLSSDVVVGLNLDQALTTVLPAVFDALSNYNRLVLWTGEVLDFDPELPAVKEVLDLVKAHPNYDPSTLIEDGDMTLRIKAWELTDVLRDLGVIGANPYDQVQSLVDGTNFVKNSHTITHDISEYVAKYPELFGLIETYDYTSTDRFKLDVLLYTRLGIGHSISLLRSQEAALLDGIANEFPKTESYANNSEEINQEEESEKEDTTSKGKRKSTRASTEKAD